MDSLKQQLKKAKQPLEAIKLIESKIEKIEEKVELPVERRQTVDRGPSTVHRQLSLGERVTVSTLNAEGVVTALGESDAEVQIGTIRMRARLSDLVRRVSEQSSSTQKAEGNKQKVEGSGRANVTVASKSPGMEVDLRGLMAEDALDKMERYLEQAFLSGLPFVRIIHGKGTGRLRQAVREALRGHEYVSKFEEGGSTEGGEGVTVALMKSG
jgi:DNA mismatch repair protein MutS2